MPRARQLNGPRAGPLGQFGFGGTNHFAAHQLTTKQAIRHQTPAKRVVSGQKHTVV
ncbi:hypothetical protein ACVMB0_003230 [Bradyrhizobium sp. USDA 4451]